MEKFCPDCKQELRCVMTGADVYLARMNKTHSSDLFMCFSCATFHVYGMNLRELVMWRDDPERGRVSVVPAPDVVAVGDCAILRYPGNSGMAYTEGEIIPLPSALEYVSKKCGHAEEVGRYLAKKR